MKNIALFLIMVVFVSCNIAKQQNITEDYNLKMKIETISGDTLNIKDLCSFKADSMYVVTPYLYLDKIVSRCGEDIYNTEWYRFKLDNFGYDNRDHICIGEGYYMLVFKLDKDIVSYVTINRVNLDFNGLNRTGFGIDEAIFRVSVDSNNRKQINY